MRSVFDRKVRQRCRGVDPRIKRGDDLLAQTHETCLQRANRVIRPVKRQKGGPPVDAGLEVHWARPKAVQMTQRVLGMIQLEVDTKILVKQVQLTPIAVVAVFHPDDRLAEIGQIEQQAILDLF